MKRMIQIAAVAMFALLVMVSSGYAQEGARTKKVTVDFPFYVGDTQMPAGEYVFEVVGPNSPQKLVMVKHVGGEAQAIATTVPATNSKKLAAGAVTFNKYGDRYYLANVQLGDPGLVQAVIKGSAERRLIKDSVAVVTKANANKNAASGSGQ